MQGISIFQQIYAPRVAHVVTGFDGVSHNTHSPYAIGGVVGSVGKMTAIVANDQADTWHIVNLKCGKIFDAVAVLGAFDESEAANMAMRYHGQYFDAVCGDVCESNTGGLQRFLNHHFYMSTNRPVYAEELAKLQDIPSTQAILWDGVQLKSHNGSSKHLLLDMMRCDDDKALLEKMDFVEEESQLDGEIAEYDALVVEAYKLESTVSKLALAMDKATSISTLKVANQTLSKPKTMRGFGVIQQLVSFELSDGQAVSIIFNVSDSEANASAKMTKDDLLVAWKYKLNSRDITAAVQPNATQNVSLNMIASRIMGLADANSEKFVAAQKKKDAMQTELVNTNQQVKDLQSQEQALLQEIADLQKQLDEKAKNNKALEAQKAEKEANKPKMPTGEELRQQGYNGVISELKKLGWADDAVTGGVSKSFIGASEKGTVNPEGVLTVAVTSKDGNMMAIVGDAIVRNSVVIIPQYGLTAQTEESYKKEAEKINKAVNFYIDDVRPFIRGELLQDVFVVKKGGVYNSDLEMNNLNYSIKVFLPRGFEKDLKENMTVKATISREYKHDWRLKSVDEIIDDPLKQQREIQEAEYQKSVGYNQLKFIKDNADSLLYEMDAKKTDSITTIEGFGQKTTVTRQQVMDVIKERIPKPQPEPTQDRPTDYRTNLANARAVAKSLGIETKGKKLERLVMDIDKAEALPNRDELDPTKLAELGVATITSIAHAENIYIEKDGKQYFSKVGNPQLYALGEWDFAKYPEGKLAAPVTQPEQAPVASSLETLKKLSKNTEFDSWAIKHGVDEGVAKSILDTNINGYFLFELVTHDLPPNDELLKFQDGSILTYYRAKSEDVKSLSDEAFNLLLSQDDYNEKTGYFAYNILRNSNKKAELDYVSSLGAMNNRFRLDAQKYGGKLYKMAQPYLSNQTVEAQPEPVSEPPMANPDRDYLQSIIDGALIPKESDMDTVIELAEKYENDEFITPLLEQALEVINQTQQAAVKGVV